MPQNIQNLRIGVCEAFLNEISLGHTKGGFNINIMREFEDMTVDKYGKAPVDKVLIGTGLKVKLKLAEPVKSILRYAIPEGRYTLVATDDKLGIGAQAGALMSQYAGLLRLHPVSRAASDRNEDIYIFKAVSTETLDLDYTVETQTVVEVTFEALIDESQPSGTLLGRIGDIDVS